MTDPISIDTSPGEFDWWQRHGGIQIERLGPATSALGDAVILVARRRYPWDLVVTGTLPVRP